MLAPKIGQNLGASFSYQDLLFRLYPLRSTFLTDIATSSNDHPWLDNAIIRSLGRGDRDNDTLRPVLAHARNMVPIGRVLLGNPTRSQNDHENLIRV